MGLYITVGAEFPVPGKPAPGWCTASASCTWTPPLTLCHPWCFPFILLFSFPPKKPPWALWHTQVSPCLSAQPDLSSALGALTVAPLSWDHQTTLVLSLLGSFTFITCSQHCLPWSCNFPGHLGWEMCECILVLEATIYWFPWLCYWGTCGTGAAGAGDKAAEQMLDPKQRTSHFCSFMAFFVLWGRLHPCPSSIIVHASFLWLKVGKTGLKNSWHFDPLTEIQILVSFSASSNPFIFSPSAATYRGKHVPQVRGKPPLKCRYEGCVVTSYCAGVMNMFTSFKSCNSAWMSWCQPPSTFMFDSQTERNDLLLGKISLWLRSWRW